MVTANASVVTARNRPRMRSAGRPMTMGRDTPTAPAKRRLRSGSSSQWTLAAPTAADPMATKATWPRLISPAQPVSSRRRRPSRRWQRQRQGSCSSRSGRTAARSAMPRAQRAGRAWSSGPPGMPSAREVGRTLATLCQLEVAWSSTRDSRSRRCRSRATITMTNIAGSTSSADPVFQTIIVSTTPMPHAATKIVASSPSGR